MAYGSTNTNQLQSVKSFQTYVMLDTSDARLNQDLLTVSIILQIKCYNIFNMRDPKCD